MPAPASSQCRSGMPRAGLLRAVLHAGGGEAQTGAVPSWPTCCKGWRLVNEAAIPKNERFRRAEVLSEPAPRLGAKTNCHQIPWAPRPDPVWHLQPGWGTGTGHCAMTSQIFSLCINLKRAIRGPGYPRHSTQAGMHSRLMLL